MSPPLSLISLCSSCSQWICNDCAGSKIRDGGRQLFKTAERSGSPSNARYVGGYNATRWVCLCGSSGSWSAVTACSRCGGGWRLDRPSLCTRRGGSHTFSDICNARIVQRRCGGGVLTWDWRGYGTHSLTEIPLASRYGNPSLRKRKWRIPRRPMVWLIPMICKTPRISYDRSCVRVRSLGRHSQF